MAQEYKKYDSQDRYEIHNARLAKDPKVWEGEKGKLVTLTFVSTSRSEKSLDLWVDAKVGGFNADLASYLKKDDVLGIRGKPSMEAWEDKDGNERTSFTLFNAEIMTPISLFQELKERGFVPGGGGKSAPNAKGKKAAGGGGKKPAQRSTRKIEQIKDDEDDELDLDDEDTGEE